MLNKDLEVTLNKAFIRAKEARHEFMTVEHLLLSLLENPSAQQALYSCGANIVKLKQEINSFIEKTTPKLPESDESKETQPTLGFQRVLQRAVFHVQSSGNTEVSGANVLVAIFSEQESQAVYVLRKSEITRLDIVNYISHGIVKNEEDQVDPSVSEESDGEEKGNALSLYAVNLNKMALKNKIDPLIGRDEELNRCIQVLCRRRKNNPLFVGEAGVGKTAIAEGLAYQVVKGMVPKVISDSVIYSLDLGSLLAGTKYRGDFEKRFKALLSYLNKDSHSVLFIDEIHTIIGAGAASGGMMDASNLLKPLLSSGSLRCIGATTYQEFQGVFEKDRALARRFQKIDVDEPSISDTIKILKGLKSKYEEHHNVKYTSMSLSAAARLSAKYLSERRLPDKAIDIIDEAGARASLLSSSAKKRKNITELDIEKVISGVAKVPSKSISTSDLKALKNLDRDLKLVVFGQDEAIDNLVSAIRLSRSGLSDQSRPVGSFLFSGPTGVGKTEISTKLASALGIKLIRFDMSEYMESHTVSRLIGAPPGYVGYDQGGLLTDSVIKNPHSVVLLDEIEKAHSDVYNLLLQVMDYGFLTDNNGRKADFRNVVLIMTTNAGVSETDKSSIGFNLQDNTSDGLAEIKKVFSPEFRNRLDSIIWFNKLSFDVVTKVVDKFITQLQAQLDEKQVVMNITKEAKLLIAQKGYDVVMGARPMSRVIQQDIKKPLANEILFGRLQKGGEVYINSDGKSIQISFNLKDKVSTTVD